MHGDAGWQKKTASIWRTMWFLGLEFWFEFGTKFTPNLFIASIAYVHAGFNSGWCVVCMWVLLVCIVVVVEFPNECSLPDLPQNVFGSILRPIRSPKPSLDTVFSALRRFFVCSCRPALVWVPWVFQGCRPVWGQQQTWHKSINPSHFRYTL